MHQIQDTIIPRKIFDSTIIPCTIWYNIIHTKMYKCTQKDSPLLPYNVLPQFILLVYHKNIYSGRLRIKTKLNL
jgi:hypothetical protein